MCASLDSKQCVRPWPAAKCVHPWPAGKCVRRCAAGTFGALMRMPCHAAQPAISSALARGAARGAPLTAAEPRPAGGMAAAVAGTASDQGFAAQSGTPAAVADALPPMPPPPHLCERFDALWARLAQELQLGKRVTISVSQVLQVEGWGLCGTWGGTVLCRTGACRLGRLRLGRLRLGG
eukprot:360570-Chlamydomonas_euryale.AAC.1